MRHHQLQVLTGKASIHSCDGGSWWPQPEQQASQFPLLCASGQAVTPAGQVYEAGGPGSSQGHGPASQGINNRCSIDV
jgi:hypothetical protein